MANGEAKLKVTAYVEPVTMRLLVRPAVGEGVAESLRVFAGLVADRTRRLAASLSGYDWEYLALACEAIVDDQLREGEVWRELVLFAVVEAHDLNRHHEAVWKIDAEGNYKLLRKAAEKWSDLDAVAVLSAVRWYFNQDRDNLISQGWWEVANRVRPKTARPVKVKKGK